MQVRFSSTFPSFAKRFLFNRNFFSALLLLSGSLWVIVNIFFLPFLIWTEGLHRPWLILKGLIPYRDFEWVRTPLDIYLLSGIYAFFGVNPLFFQITIFSLHLIISIFLFFFLKRKSFLIATVAYITYCLLTFYLYSTVQIGEIMVSLFLILAFASFWEYRVTNKSLPLFLTGMFSGFAVMTKQTSALTIPVFIFALIFLFNNSFLFKRLLHYGGGLLLVVIPFLTYFAIHNALDDFFYYTVYFNLFIYADTAPHWGFSDGMRLLLLHVSILVPLLFVKNKYLPRKDLFVLIALIMSLFPSLLPTFWSYRLITALPLLSIAIAVFFLHFLNYMHKKKKSKRIVITFTASLACFLILAWPSLRGYNQYIQNVGGYGFRQYTLEYSDSQRQVVSWIKKNTEGNEKIFNMDSNIVMFYSNRLPHNKYVDALPWVYFPLDQSYRDIVAIPPRVVIYDSTLPTFWPMLKKWQFIEYLHAHYTLRKKIEAIEIYTLSNVNNN